MKLRVPWRGKHLENRFSETKYRKSLKGHQKWGLLLNDCRKAKQAVSRVLSTYRDRRLALSAGQILSWAEVSKTHRTRNGIYQRNGALISLLTDFGRINACYPDVRGDTLDVIYYTGSGRRGNQKLDLRNRALLDAIDTRHAVPLFNKLSVGRWQFTGHWLVTEGKHIFDETQQRMVWRFKLERAHQYLPHLEQSL